jgi:hypothetical protein
MDHLRIRGGHSIIVDAATQVFLKSRLDHIAFGTSGEYRSGSILDHLGAVFALHQRAPEVLVERQPISFIRRRESYDDLIKREIA